ncbi:MAG: hypothetical protein HY343_05065 [Lentisphaerae bacterium]|nr:hypothetical protein [Lentisphaerota bacterium]
MKTFSLIVTVCFMFVAAQALHAVDPAPAAAPAAAEKKADDKAAAPAPAAAPAMTKSSFPKSGTIIVLKDGSVKLATTLYSLESGNDAVKKQLTDLEGKRVKVMGDVDTAKKTISVASVEAIVTAAPAAATADKPAEKAAEKAPEQK